MNDEVEKRGDDLLRIAHQALRLRDVYLRREEVSLKEDFVPALERGEQFLIQHRMDCVEGRALTPANSEDAKAREYIDFRIAAGARFLRPSEDGKPARDFSEDEIEDKKILEISVEFSALYERRGSDLPEEAVAEFGTRNATFHVWPYWRELLHSICSRIHIPGAVLPMMTLPPVQRRPTAGKAANKDTPSG